MIPYNDDFSIESRKFSINGLVFELVCCEVGHRKNVEDSIDTVKNTATGNKKRMTRRRLIELMKEKNAKKV